jgi:hypothetical protein
MTQQSDNKDPLRVEFQVHFRTGRHGRKHLRKGPIEKDPGRPGEDVPRLARLLALAHRWNRLIEEGVVANHAEIARVMGLSRARVTQITDLLYLAPGIQEEILLPRNREKFALDVPERAMRPIIRLTEWNDQRRLWEKTVWSIDRTGGEYADPRHDRVHLSSSSGFLQRHPKQ